MRTRLLLTILLTGAIPAGAGPALVDGLDSLSRVTLERALDRLDVDGSELGFDKLYAEDDTFRLGIVERLLGDPIATPAWQAETVEKIREAVGEPASLVARLGELSEAEADPPVSRSSWPSAGEIPVHAGGALRDDRFFRASIQTFVRRLNEANGWLQRSLDGIPAAERESLTVLAPAFWGDADHPADRLRKGAIHFELGQPADTTIRLREKPALDAATHLDRAALTQAIELVGEAVIEFTTALRERPLPSVPMPMGGVTGEVLAVEDTPFGMLVVGGPHDNQYSTHAMRRIAFLFEPGGNDVYRGRAASALGTLLRPFSVLVDVAGDDLYDAQGRSFAIGGALFGVAYLLDLSGNDSYRGDDGSLGAGFFGGGVLYDGGGRDFFEGRNLCEGAGAFGLGILLSDAVGEAPTGIELQRDRAYEEGIVRTPGTGAVPVRSDENDTYVCARQGQGFASTYGVGLLFDSAGNDTYRAGGLYLHAPLLPNDFQSLSQGFSIGFRPRAGGGVGILLDEAGNDFYDAEVYAQGASYWYSIGLLHDGGGNDRYLATQYAQGAGIHLAVGSLWDAGGDDHYVSKFGVTQGTAHDLSSGLLYDESGNDFYVVSDGQGVSITNSVALFIDRQGDDFYATPRGGQARTHWARGFSGAAIFLDLEGDDAYPAEAAGENAAEWISDTYAIGIDLDRNVELPGETVEEPILTAEDSLRSVEELFKTASIWEVGSARPKVRRARKALIAKGIEAVVYAVQEKLGTDDGLEYRAIRELAEAYPDSCTARLLPRLEDPDEKVVRNAIRLLGDLKRSDAVESLIELLGDEARERQWNRAIDALGKIGTRESAATIRPFLNAEEERRRILAVVATRALNDSAAVPELVDLLEDPILTVRAASARALESFGAPAAERLLEALQSNRTQERIALRTLGRIAISLADSTDATSIGLVASTKEKLVAASTSADGAIRATAVEALLTLSDEAVDELLRERMIDETDPLVGRTYRRGMGNRVRAGEGANSRP